MHLLERDQIGLALNYCLQLVRKGFHSPLDIPRDDAHNTPYWSILIPLRGRLELIHVDRKRSRPMAESPSVYCSTTPGRATHRLPLQSQLAQLAPASSSR